MKYKKTIIASAIFVCLLGILLSPLGRGPLIWLALEFSARHQNIGSLSSISEDGVSVSVRFPREGRGWPIYVDDETSVPEDKIDSTINLRVLNRGRDSFDVTVRKPSSREQETITLAPGDSLDAISTTLDSYIYESKRSSRIRVRDDGHGVMWPPLIYFRSSSAGRVHLELHYSSNEEVLFDPPIDIYSSIPRDSL